MAEDKYIDQQVRSNTIGQNDYVLGVNENNESRLFLLKALRGERIGVYEGGVVSDPLVNQYYDELQPGSYPSLPINANGDPLVIPAPDLHQGLMYARAYFNGDYWEPVYRIVDLPETDLSSTLKQTDIEESDVVWSDNKLNPDSVYNPSNDSKFWINANGNYNPFTSAETGIVLKIDLLNLVDFTLGGYHHPDFVGGKTLTWRIENADGIRTRYATLPQNEAPVHFVKNVADQERYLLLPVYRSTAPKDYAHIMILEGDRTADYPGVFIPYGIISNNPRVIKIKNLKIEAGAIRGNAQVINPVVGDDFVVTQKQLSDKAYATENFVLGKGYGVPTLKDTKSTNLQNPANKILNQWIIPGSGTITAVNGAICYFYDGKKDEVVTLSNYHHPNYAAGQSLCLRFDPTVGSMSKVILPQDESPYVFTFPADGKITYQVYRPSYPQDYSQIMLNSGNVALPYAAYFEPIKEVIAINGLPLRASASTDGNDYVVQTLLTACKILIEGCSYPYGGGVNVKDKAWVNKLSEWINHNVVNFGVGGDRLVDITHRIRTNTPSAFTSRGLGVQDINATYGTIRNMGNETLNSQGINSDLYREELKENIQANLAMGAFPVLSTDFFTNNPFLTDILREIAREHGTFFHDIGTIGEKLLKIGTPATQWWGTHPNTRGNSVTAYEEILLWRNLWRPKQSIKIFRKRSAFPAATVQDLNYDSIYQRVQKFKEITVGNSSLSETSEANGWGYMDRANDAPDYLYSTAYTDEYIELMTGNPVSFDKFALLDIIIDHIKPTYLEFKLKTVQDAGFKFWVKNHLNPADYAPTVKDNTSVVVPIDAATYAAVNFVAGDVYTTPHVKNSSGFNVNLTVKGKFYSQATGYILCLVSAVSYPPTKIYDQAGTLTKVSGAGPASMNYTGISAVFSRHSYEFLKTYGKPEGSFTQLTNVSYADGYYSIKVTATDIRKFLQYDNLKLVIENANGFSLSDVVILHSGGMDKVQKKVHFEEKRSFTEKIADNTFDANWTNVGRWTNSNAVLTQMSATYRDYPPLIAPADRHISLSFDANDVPATIKRTITLTPKAGYRKAAVRVVARVFPKLYRPDVGETAETTATRLITPDSYDGGQLCLGIKGNNIVNVLREPLFIGWTEVYFEFEVPPFQSEFELQLYRDPFDIVDKANYKNHTYPLDICWVSCQVEGE